MVETGMFDVAAHLDLSKKFAIYPSVDMSAEISAALDAIAASNMSVEINTSGWYKPCEEAYPSPSILRGCLERGISVLVGADAHSPEDLIRGYDRAYALLREVGFTEIASYAGRQKIMRPIPNP